MPATQRPSPPARRKRRSTREVIDAILNAASEEFEVHGYDGATTAAIARKAGVAEALIFSNFGTKSKLFHASIFEPLNRHLAEFIRANPIDPAASGAGKDALRRRYVEELRAFIDLHSRKFLSLFFMQTYNREGGALDDIEGVQDYLSFATAMQQASGEEQAPGNPRIMGGISFLTIFSCVVFRRWVFPGHQISDDEIFTTLVDFMLDGINAHRRG